MTDDAQQQSGIPLWFSVPPQFIEMDLTGDPLERLGRTLETMRDNLVDASDEQCVRLAASQEALIKIMLENSVRYAASCVWATEDASPRMVFGQFTVSVQDVELDGENPMGVLRNSLEMPGRKREIEPITIDRNPGLLVADESRYASRPALEPDSTESDKVERLVRQIQAIVAFPDRRRIATFALASEFLSEWENFLGLMSDILGTVSFSAPGQTSSIENRLSGLL